MLFPWLFLLILRNSRGHRNAAIGFEVVVGFHALVDVSTVSPNAIFKVDLSRWICPLHSCFDDATPEIHFLAWLPQICVALAPCVAPPRRLMWLEEQVGRTPSLSILAEPSPWIWFERFQRRGGKLACNVYRRFSLVWREESWHFGTLVNKLQCLTRKCLCGSWNNFQALSLTKGEKCSAEITHKRTRQRRPRHRWFN